MICTFLRAVQYAERLHRSSGRRLLSPQFTLNKACFTTEPSLRWGLQERKEKVLSGCIFEVSRKTIWTQGPRPQKAQNTGKQVSLHRSQKGETAIPTTQKVKEAGRDFTYLIVVLIGIGITGGLFYVIFKELFSSSSPSIIYGKALEKCRTHPEVIGFFGEPVRGYGEMTRRGRRHHVSFIDYVKDGLKHTRVKFYIEGSEPGRQGTVHAEVKENPNSGEYEFRYIFVEVESYPRKTIIIEDNRFQEN
ncbi:mitochondrial import inner membrane translocase subunit Tim21 isoform X1 [Cavia porcellus]|uniref:Mitochondrial import inner membrane translocase subunit Tim21 n=1 Tax=Cavia porcellus TaxID=10141 RepID=H0VIP7_CAVPO|nr:mitochondrial import inner membrane translocase subunit Tim21 [Cavia porcellus]XP_013004492.1 mitochondrial import inner membrane translocase subunit Tim21 [Cavia porcellus]